MTIDLNSIIPLVAATFIGAMSFLIKSAISSLQKSNDGQTVKIDKLSEMAAEDRGYNKVLANRITQLEARVTTLEAALLNQRRIHVGPE